MTILYIGVNIAHIIAPRIYIEVNFFLGVLLDNEIMVQPDNIGCILLLFNTTTRKTSPVFTGKSS